MNFVKYICWLVRMVLQKGLAKSLLITDIWRYFFPSVSAFSRVLCLQTEHGVWVLFTIIPVLYDFCYTLQQYRLTQTYNWKVGLCSQMHPQFLLLGNLSRKFIGFKSKCPSGSLNNLASAIETYCGCSEGALGILLFYKLRKWTAIINLFWNSITFTKTISCIERFYVFMKHKLYIFPPQLKRMGWLD